MALITHLIAIKNRLYSASTEYLTKQHDEITNGRGQIVKYEPIYDENGMLKERENYAVTYLKSDGSKGNLDDWSKDCNETNAKFHKNQNENDIKAHHFVMSFPRSDYDNGLTVEEAQKIAEAYCREHFKGHQCLIATHGDQIDNPPGEGNIHCHIVVNSVREREIEKQDYMTRCADGETIKPSQYEAGGKLVNSNRHQEWLMQGVSEYEKKYNLVQEDYAGKAHENKVKKESTRDRLHDKVLSAAENSMNESQLIDNLWKEGVEYKRRGGHISVRERQREGEENKKNPYSTLKQIGLEHKDLTPDLYQYQERKSTKETLREKVLEAVENSKNEKELIENLKQAGVDYKRGRGNEISVRETPTEENERKGKYTRLDSLTLTPHDLTPDLYKFYKPERDDKVFERQKKELEESIKKEVKEQTAREIEDAKKQNSNEFSKKGWNNSKTFKPYTVSRFNENGEPRSLLETTMILAYTIINGEMPDWAKTEKQRLAEARWNERQKQIYTPKQEKLDNLNQAIQYSKEMKIDTPKQLAEKLQSPDLSADEKFKADFIKQQYDLANDKEYCYAKIFKKRQQEIKDASKEDIDRARRQLEEMQRKDPEHKNKTPKQKEREEYERELATAETGRYFIMVNEARNRDRGSDGPQNTRGGGGRSM